MDMEKTVPGTAGIFATYPREDVTLIQGLLSIFLLISNFFIFSLVRRNNRHNNVGFVSQVPYRP